MKRDRLNITPGTVVPRPVPRFAIAIAGAAMGLVALAGCSGSRGGNVVSSSGHLAFNTSLIASGASSPSGEYKDWRFSVGNRFIELHGPGLLFGVQETPEGQRELTYVTLLRLPAEENGIVLESEVTLRFIEESVSMQDILTVNDVKWELVLNLEADRGDGTIEGTALTLDGEVLDPSRGRLFLVDFSSNPVTHEQLDTTLPTAPPALDNKAAIEEYGHRTIRELRLADERVQAFIGE